MTTPSGFNRRSLLFYGAARGAAAERASTAEFIAALRAGASALGLSELGLNLQSINQLRSAAVRQRNAQERFQRAPDVNAIDASTIGQVPYGRGLAEQAALPIYQVGIQLHTIDDEGEVSSRYTTVRFTGQLEMTKADLLGQVQQDAEALADNYGESYAGHDVVELTAV